MSNEITFTIKPVEGKEGIIDVSVDVYDEFDLSNLSKADLVAVAVMNFIETLGKECEYISD